MAPRTRLLFASALVVLAAAAYFLLHGAGASAAALRLYGNVDIRDVNLGFRVAGRVQEVLVDEGDGVQPGQLLARLDPLPIEREIAEAQAEVTALGARLALLRAGNRPEEVAQAAAQVEEREATLRNAETLLAREQRLASSGASTPEHLEQAQAARDEARARLQAGREALAQSRSGFRKEEIAEGAANLARARASLAQAQLRLEDTRLLAPAAGIVLTRAVEPGAMVATNSTALALSLVQPVWVRAYVKETDLAAARPGTAVTVHVDSLPDKTFRGQIGFLSPTAEFTPKNVETPDLRTDLVYRVRIVVEDPGTQLRQGMPVTVDLPRPAA